MNNATMSQGARDLHARIEYAVTAGRGYARDSPPVLGNCDTHPLQYAIEVAVSGRRGYTAEDLNRFFLHDGLDETQRLQLRLGLADGNHVRPMRVLSGLGFDMFLYSPARDGQTHARLEAVLREANGASHNMAVGPALREDGLVPSLRAVYLPRTHILHGELKKSGVPLVARSQ